MKLRLRLILATLLLTLAAAGSVVAQSTLPIAFSDPAPSVVLWPEPIETTILNNTTVSLVVSLQFTAFSNEETGSEYPAVELLQRYPPFHHHRARRPGFAVTSRPRRGRACARHLFRVPCSRSGLGQRGAAQGSHYRRTSPRTGTRSRRTTDGGTRAGPANHPGGQQMDSQCTPRASFHGSDLRPGSRDRLQPTRQHRRGKGCPGRNNAIGEPEQRARWRPYDHHERCIAQPWGCT